MPGISAPSCDDLPYGPGQTDYEYDKWRQEQLDTHCPKCAGSNWEISGPAIIYGIETYYKACNDCGHTWEQNSQNHSNDDRPR